MDVKRELRRAREAFDAAKWTVSELTCRAILKAEPKCAAAYELLAIIAAHAGATGQVIGYLESAEACRPERYLRKLLSPRKATRQRQALVDMANGRRADDAPEQRYLVIKSWGFGFWSDVSHTLGGLLLAEITGRTPVVHWGEACRFGDGSVQDSFQKFFEPVSSVPVPALRQIGNASFFPSKWNSANLLEDNVFKWTGRGGRLGPVEFLNRAATVAVADFYIGIAHAAHWLPAHHSMSQQPLEKICFYLAEKYLRPSPAVRARCDSFYRENLMGAPLVAVHLRGSDKAVEDRELHAINQKILAALDAIPVNFRIFLLTDDNNYLSLVKDRYRERVVATQCQRTSGTTGTHYLASTDRELAGLEIMTDTYLALRADKFIGNARSNVAAMISVMRAWPPGGCTLFGAFELAILRLRVFRDLRADPFSAQLAARPVRDYPN